MTDIYIVSGVRTAIGDFGGALKDVSPSTLVASVTREAVSRAGVAPDAIGLGVFGQVIHTEPRDMYISRVAVIEGGLPQETPAFTLNRLCGSGLQAILAAANAIRAGEAEVAVAGGVENMSRAPYHLPALRWGQKMGDVTATDVMVGSLTDPFHRVHMGITAENVAARYEISREQQDALAVESHRRASRAIKEGRFKDQILGIELKTRKGTTVFDTDEHVRHEIKPEDVTGLRPAFKKDGSITAGNASGINDGAGAVVVASGEAVKRLNLRPLARLVATGHSGVDPAYMGIGPVPATQQALQRAGLKVNDFDVIEANEAFAAQACAVAKELAFDPERLNPNGSGISLGHPIGATGAIITVKALYELRRTEGRRALVTMCIGGGQGIAAIFERA
ncbi:Beta-ketothiolase BktB [Rhodovastum atsumiense]|uniref:Acetyl-CoA C-acyltransferase family protein n=1 Tax=Rhodovastum atsumiense TaxID=504468 RepID=A0A5M6J3M2_9PROT|nr:acetyl-CoA C-acyltransferase family protein [Rhodovastum atsumiense]KAA5614265.1 acetyl-CoA C-acyltransferase family protein [Rhodovastum atsumiense]CAH2604718.1 Beta-ketothiolase BktB [Rhodovastum atsumiense]